MNMVAPIFKWYNEDDSAEYDSSSNPLNLGSVDPGVSGTPKRINLWNNKGGSVDVSDMTDVRITTVTKNGYVSGDSGPAGAEGAYGRYVVEDGYIHCKSITNGDSVFAAIGGAVTKPLAPIRGTILTSPNAPVGVPDEVVGGLMTVGTYHYVIVAVDESGETLKGNGSTSVVITGTDNQVILNWDEVEGATSYKIFRTTSSGTYGASSQVGVVVGATTYKDIAASPSTGHPLAVATVQHGHKHIVDLQAVIPTDADAGAVELNTRILYKYI
jgi:hypothetical protein